MHNLVFNFKSKDTKKIKNLINKKNSDKKILSIKKPSIKKDNYKQNEENESSVISSMKGKPLKDNSNKKPLLIKPLNKPESQKIISNKPINLNKPTITNSSQSKANLTNQNINSKTSQNLNQDKKTLQNNITLPLKSPAKPAIQLIAKPKNINNNVINYNWYTNTIVYLFIMLVQALLSWFVVIWCNN